MGKVNVMSPAHDWVRKIEWIQKHIPENDLHDEIGTLTVEQKACRENMQEGTGYP